MKLNETSAKMDGYEKISDLYPDFPNWQILVRLVKKSYR